MDKWTKIRLEIASGRMSIREEIRRYKQSQAEVFMPLAHSPGMAQFDFGEAKVIYRGRETKAMFSVMSLPHGDALFIQAFPTECGKEGRREFIKILRLLEKHSPEELGRTVRRALEINALTADLIRILVQENREQPAKMFILDGRPHLQDHSVPEPHLFKYNQLLPSESHNHEGTRNQKYRTAETRRWKISTSNHSRRLIACRSAN